MVKYIIEGGIDFYEELYKSFDEPDITAEETNNLCQITGLPLVERFIELECNHKISIMAYKGFIVNQIDESSESIRCPYCRKDLKLKFNDANFAWAKIPLVSGRDL